MKDSDVLLMESTPRRVKKQKLHDVFIEDQETVLPNEDKEEVKKNTKICWTFERWTFACVEILWL